MSYYHNKDGRLEQFFNQHDAERALEHIPNTIKREQWLIIGTALKTEYGENAENLFYNWSENGKKSDRQNARDTWKSIVEGTAGIGALINIAKQYGYEPPKAKPLTKEQKTKYQREQAKRKAAQQEQQAKQQRAKQAKQQRTQQAIHDVLQVVEPADANSTSYTKNKLSSGRGAYTLSSKDMFKVTSHHYLFNDLKGLSSDKASLFIPLQNKEGKLVAAQLITDGKPKRLIAGSIKAGSYAYLGVAPLPNTTATIYIGEGYATVDSVLQADTNAFAVMAIDAGNLPFVAKIICQRHPNADIKILADNDKSGVGQAKAQDAAQRSTATCLIPDWIAGQAKSTDWNDVHVVKGLKAVQQCLNIPLPTPDDNYRIPVSTPVYFEAPRTPSVYDLGETYTHEQLKQTKEYKIAYDECQRHLRKKKAGKKAYIHINQEHVLAMLCACIDSGINTSKLISDMNSGKTWAVMWLLKNHPLINSTLVITTLAALNESIVTNANAKHGIKGCAYSNLQPHDDYELITSTFNSLHKVIEKRGLASFDLILVDESEQCATYMATGTIDNKHQAANALQAIAKESKYIVLADAHAGHKTHLFEARFFPDLEFISLFNHYQPFKDWTYSVTDSYETGIAELESALKQGKNVFTVFTSSNLAYQTAKMMEMEGITTTITTIIVCKATRKEDATKEVLNDPDTFKLYQVCFVSPIAGAGVSIEGEHFHQTIAFITHDPRTPNYKNALQMLFRARDLIDRHITLVKIDNPLNNMALQTFESIDTDLDVIIEMRSQTIERAFTGDKEAKRLLPRLAASQSLYEADIMKSEVADYWQFWKKFFDELQKKGLTEIKLNEQIASIDTKTARKKARQQIEQEIKQDFINADYVSGTDYKALIDKNNHASNRLSKEEAAELQKTSTVNKLIPHAEIINDTPTTEQSAQAYDLKQNGCSNKMDAIYCSQLTAIEAKKIEKMYVSGIGVDQYGALDLFDNKPLVLIAERQLYTALAKTIGLTCDDDGVFTIKETELDKSTCRKREGKANQVKVIANTLPEYNATHDTKISPQAFSEDPLTTVVQLLRDQMGLKLKKVRNQEKYLLVEEQPIIELLNSKRFDDCNKYQNLLNDIHSVLKQEVKKESFNAVQIEVTHLIPTAKVLGTDRTDTAYDKYHITHQVMQVPIDFRTDVINEYIDIANNPRQKSNRFRPLALANIWLIETVEKYKIKAEKGGVKHRAVARCFTPLRNEHNQQVASRYD